MARYVTSHRVQPIRTFGHYIGVLKLSAKYVNTYCRYTPRVNSVNAFSSSTLFPLFYVMYYAIRMPKLKSGNKLRMILIFIGVPEQGSRKLRTIFYRERFF